jgi:hypothetical protein
VRHHAANLGHDSGRVNEERGPTRVGERRDKDFACEENVVPGIGDDAREPFDDPRRRGGAGECAGRQIRALCFQHGSLTVAGDRDRRLPGLVAAELARAGSDELVQFRAKLIGLAELLSDRSGRVRCSRRLAALGLTVLMLGARRHPRALKDSPLCVLIGVEAECSVASPRAIRPPQCNATASVQRVCHKSRLCFVFPMTTRNALIVLLRSSRGGHEHLFIRRVSSCHRRDRPVCCVGHRVDEPAVAAAVRFLRAGP